MKKKDDWKLETIRELRKYKLERRMFKLMEIVYHTLLPVYFTYILIYYEAPIMILFILFIIIVRMKVK